MPRPRSDNELESLRAQAEALQQKIKQVEARNKAKKAAADHRRWQLAGQVSVQQMQDAPASEFFRSMMALLDRRLRAASDRALFGLPPVKTNGHGDGDAIPAT